MTSLFCHHSVKYYPSCTQRHLHPSSHVQNECSLWLVPTMPFLTPYFPSNPAYIYVCLPNSTYYFLYMFFFGCSLFSIYVHIFPQNRLGPVRTGSDWTECIFIRSTILTFFMFGLQSGSIRSWIGWTGRSDQDQIESFFLEILHLW